MTEQDAKNELLAQRLGAEVVVVAGRKIPLGVRGILRWSGQGNFGPSMGISVPGEPKLLYTAPHNLSVLFPGLGPGETPEGGWVKLWEEVQSGITVPKRDSVVRSLVKDVGWVQGVVFWSQDGRVGFKPQGQTEGIFASLEDSQILMGDGSWKPCKVPVRAVPAGKAPAPAGFKDLSLDDGEDSPKNSPLRETYGLDKPLDLPPPFSEITHFTRKAGEKFFSARDKNGEEICTLPEDTVWGLLPDLNDSDPLDAII